MAVYIDAYGDVNGIGMLLLFGPRWLFMLPWALLVPATLLARRKRIVIVALVGVLVTRFSVMEFELPAPFRDSASRRALRVVTYNTDQSTDLAVRIRADLARWSADVVVLQDCNPVVSDSLRVIDGIIVNVTREFCMISRMPVESIDLAPSRARQDVDGVGRIGNAIRYRVRTVNGVLPIYSIHFNSPRDALWSARGLDFKRIDHVLVPKALVVEAVVLERGFPSEHQPVVVDLGWRQGGEPRTVLGAQSALLWLRYALRPHAFWQAIQIEQGAGVVRRRIGQLVQHGLESE